MVRSDSSDNNLSNRHIALQCHATSVRGEIQQVQITVNRNTTGLQLQYQITGDMDSLKIPDSQAAVRCDELWRHTCAEVFFTATNTVEYCELNFSPSSQWAAYQFADYRQGVQPLQCEPPSISVVRDSGQLNISVSVALPAKYQVSLLQLGLCMVIEDTAGHCSYWALRHDAVRPDFHLRDSWICVV